MSVRGLLLRIITIAAAVAILGWFSQKFATWPTLGIWAAAMAAACALAGVALRAQPAEKVTAVNYVAGVLLPWGYRIGRGKLPAIVLISWMVWVLIGVAVALAQRQPAGTASAATLPAESGQRGAVVMMLLIAAWLVDGAALLWLLGVIASSANRSQQSSALLIPVLVLIGIIAGSAALVASSTTARSAWAALALAGGPPLLVGLAYGVFMIVILTAGRNARWN